MNDSALPIDRLSRNARWLALARHARGDPDAFEKLYAATAPWLLRLVRRLVGADDAEDVLAEVFLQVWRELDRFDAARAPVPVWLSVIAHSRALDHLRRVQGERVRVELAALCEPAVASADPLAIVARVQEARLLELHCQAQLSGSEREVLALAYFEELSQAEIAHRLGMPLGTVKTRMNRAHRKLRLAMAQALASGSLEARWVAPVGADRIQEKGAGHA